MNTDSKTILTVEEANQRLPLVRSIVRDIVELYHDVHERRRRLDELRQRTPVSDVDSDDGGPYSDEVEQMKAELDQDIDRLEGYQDELRELGAELKDPVTGLVDFLSVLDSREVYLCWKPADTEVAYWRELDAGITERQLLC